MKGVNVTGDLKKRDAGLKSVAYEKERKQKVQPKEKNEVVESYRKTARLRLQEMYRDGFNSKRSTDKTNADTRNKNLF